jgi:hypothetical protein
MKSLVQMCLQGMMVFLLTGGSLTGQETAFVKAELVTLSWKGKIANLWYETKEGPRTLDVYERGFTAAESYIGPKELKFYPDRSALDLSPEKRPEPVASAVLPAGGGEFLLIFVERINPAGSWKVEVMDNSVSNLPEGGYRVVNLTKDSYNAYFDREAVAVKASGITVVRPAKRDSVRDLPIQIMKGKQLVYSSIWGHRETQRATVFLMPASPGAQFLTIRRYFQPVVERETAGNP